MTRRLAAWSALYLLVCILGAWRGVGGVELQETFIAKLVAIAFILSSSVLLAARIEWRYLQLLLIVILVGATILNVLDVMGVAAVSMVAGRAAGLYVNPNIMAVAVFGIGLALLYMRPLQSHWWLLLAGFSVALSLSRGGAAAAVAVLLTLIVAGGFSRRTVWRLCALAGMIAVAVTFSRVAQPLLEALTQSSALERRVEGFYLSGLGTNNETISARLRALEAGWRMFGDKPLLGQGLAATVGWDLSAGAHNVYIMHLAEFGILGSLLYPLFVVALVGGAPRRLSWPVAAMLLVAALFSHNVLEDRAQLSIAVLLGAWCQSKTTQPSRGSSARVSQTN